MHDILLVVIHTLFSLQWLFRSVCLYIKLWRSSICELPKQLYNLDLVLFSAARKDQCTDSN